jgi:threonine/homoserine/homoserine lactone efflux protein
MHLAKVYIWGLIISFLGSLPLGPLNLVTTYISVSKGANAAILFSLGCILISKRQKFFKMLEWITIIIILVLAIFSFNAAIREAGFSRAIPANFKYPFWSGVLLSAIDPMKIPFWFLWSTFLMGSKILLPKYNYYNYYVVGIGFGSLLGFMVFIYGGAYLISTINRHQDLVNWVIGSILLLTAIIQIYRVKNRKEDIQKSNKEAKIIEMPVSSA